MEDSTDDDLFYTVPLAMRIPTEKAEPDVSAPTARRRRRSSPGRYAAKPRGRGRKAASSGAKGGSGKRGRGRKARASAATSDFVPVSAGVSRKAGHGVQHKATGHTRSETAEEKALQAVTMDSEADIDRQAEEYVSNILPDQAMVVYPDHTSGHAPNMASPTYGDSYECPEEMDVMSPKRRSGRPSRAAPVRRRRRMPVEGDERVVCKVLPGKWSSRLPLGTVVRRPSTKLVQLVAQAINESPHQMLRVTHVYAALQNKYPYYKLLDKKDISSWKSSVRHALFQKWFIKLLPKASLCESVRPRSYFWGVNYDKRPREWEMPGARRREDQQDDDNETTMLSSALHLENEAPTKTLSQGKVPPAFRLELEDALHLENEAPTKALSQEKVPSAFRLELEESLFSLPEPKWPPVNKRARSSGRRNTSEGLPGPSTPQPIEPIGSPSSSRSQSNTDLSKSEFVKLDRWLAPERMDDACQPSATATTESTPSVSITMATQSTTASVVEAAVNSLEKPWQTQPGEHFMKLRPQDEQQQEDIMMFQQSLQEQQEQQQFHDMLEASLQDCKEAQQAWGELVSTQQGDALMKYLTTTEPGRATDPFDKFVPSASPRGEQSFGALAYTTDDPLAPRPVLCSPRYISEASSSPRSTSRPSTLMPAPVKQPPVNDEPPAPSQHKDASPITVMPLDHAHRLGHVLISMGRRSPHRSDETVSCLFFQRPVWERMLRREIYNRGAEPGRRISAILVAPLPWDTTLPMSPSSHNDDEDKCGDADFRSAIQADFLNSSPARECYESKSPPLYLGDGFRAALPFSQIAPESCPPFL